MLPQEIIRRKRDGKSLTGDDIAAFVGGIATGKVSEGQVAALAMAVFFNGMSRDEAVALTLAMRDSGEVLDWSDLPGPVTDKHSTGGVGDNVSLMLAPIVAACGAYVPMISGRGLGHTGGTLDKMDAIPGYVSQPDNKLFRKAVLEAGCAIIGQTAALAPADKRFYAIRDVTATVESIPLITASILSKKLAAGLQSLVLDVKVGNGAFMTRGRDAAALATSLVEVANGAGMPTSALITSMNEPLASAAGNAVEVHNAVDFLTGRRRDKRLLEVTMALAADMLVAAGIAGSNKEGLLRAGDALDSGRAAETFERMVSLLGGPGQLRRECRQLSARRTGREGGDRRPCGLCHRHRNARHRAGSGRAWRRPHHPRRCHRPRRRHHRPCLPRRRGREGRGSGHRARPFRRRRDEGRRGRACRLSRSPKRARRRTRRWSGASHPRV